MFISIVSIFAVSFFVSLIAACLLKKIKAGPGKKISQSGGLAIYLSFLAACLLSFIFKSEVFKFSKEMFGILLGATLIFILGFIDDRIELSVSKKIFGQLIAAAIVVSFGVQTQIVGVGLLGNIIITFFWLLIVTNAFNHLDILDGLLASIAFLSALTFLIFSFLTLNFSIAFIFAILAGSVLGFFIHNFPDAKIYMGNSGSHFLGFILAALSITISYATLKNRIALLIPILVLGFPIFDTLFVMWVRFLKHKPFWEKSNDHLALRLVAQGCSKKEAVFDMFLLALLFSVCGIFILLVPNYTGIIALILLALICFYVACKMKKVKVD